MIESFRMDVIHGDMDAVIELYAMSFNFSFFSFEQAMTNHHHSILMNGFIVYYLSITCHITPQ